MCERQSWNGDEQERLNLSLFIIFITIIYLYFGVGRTLRNARSSAAAEEHSIFNLQLNIIDTTELKMLCILAAQKYYIKQALVQ